MEWAMRAFGLALALLGLVESAAAQTALSGSFAGEYVCGPGLTGMTLHLRAPQANGRVSATAVYYAHPKNPEMPTGCYELTGTLNRATGDLVLDPQRWVLRPGENWFMTSLEGRLDTKTGALTGRVFRRDEATACTTFVLQRNARPFVPTPSACQAKALVS
jgi:hypothetical protein